MKAHIENKASNTGSAMTISDGEVNGSMQYASGDLSGAFHFKASIDLVCDGDTREFDLKKVALESVIINADLSDDMAINAHDAIRNQFVGNELNQLVLDHITTTINDNKEYLLDNHHDFAAYYYNYLDTMDYKNTGVVGHTWMAEDEDEQKALLLNKRSEDIAVLKVAFNVGYTLEFLDDSKQELVMKDFIVNGIEAYELVYEDEDYLEMTEEEKAILGLRVIDAIKYNFIEVRHDICKKLGGNPIDE